MGRKSGVFKAKHNTRKDAARTNDDTAEGFPSVPADPLYNIRKGQTRANGKVPLPNVFLEFYARFGFGLTGGQADRRTDGQCSTNKLE